MAITMDLWTHLWRGIHFVARFRAVQGGRISRGLRPGKATTMMYPFFPLVQSRFNREFNGDFNGFNNGDLSWWFGTYELYVSMYWEWNVIIPTDELIFFRGVGPTTNQ